MTFFLVLVVFAMVTDQRNTHSAIAGLAIGLVIVFDMLFGYTLTGAAINPARAFGPELVANAWTDFWIWYVGPMAGGAIAALLYDELYLRPAAPTAASPSTGVDVPSTGVDEPGPGPRSRRHLVGTPRYNPTPPAHSSSGLGHRPLTAAARVRIPYAPFRCLLSQAVLAWLRGSFVTPVPEMPMRCLPRCLPRKSPLRQQRRRGSKAAALPMPRDARAFDLHATPRDRRRLVALSAMARNVCAASWWATPVSATRLDAASAASSIVA